ncbi:TrmB family transcriptional regulator [Salinigranum salinum]|uniref:TrmB family transcriptional regulator n=1 Tax=Salinigranum salinum TaxID=1364937 RepID=UPI001260B5E2|nr:TrmB family transcriptional regulator sugar-binding domain-containing protein [Salinigranum salinum]
MTDTESPDDATLRAELSLFGLSDAEVDTYLALLPHGEATTRTVAEDAGVTQQAVYNIADRLERRGLVQVREYASPKTVRAVPPREAIASLSERLESLAPSLEDRFEAAAPREPEIQIVKSRETARKRLHRAISGAEHEIFVAVPEPVFPDIEADLRAAVDRDLLVFVLLGEADTNDDAGANKRRFAGVADAVRVWDAGLPFVYAVDDTSAMIGDPDFLSGTHDDKQAVAVSQHHLTGTVHGMYLSAYWPASAEAYVTDPDPLPKSFDWFRQAVLHTFLHQQRGTALWADITTVSGEEIAGPVSRVNQAFVEPATNEYTLETSITLETADDEVSFGGAGAFIEEYETARVSLREDP